MAKRITNWIPNEIFKIITKHMPRPCADIVVFCNNEVLLLKRLIPPLKDFWLLPGGSIRRGETPKQAARRILKEEISIVANHFKEIGSACYFLRIRQDIIITFSVELESPIISLDYQHNDYLWTSVNNLPEPMHKTTIKQIMEANKLRR